MAYNAYAYVKVSTSLQRVNFSTHWSMIEGRPSTFTATPHNHDSVYVKEGGTSFSGTYPLVARVGARNFYSEDSITFNGTTNTLAVSGNITIAGTSVSVQGHGHAASEITESTTRRFVSDSDKNKWNGALSEFIGAHAGVANGTKGLVPAPSEAQAGAFLRGDGNWIPVTPSLIGASDSGHAHSNYLTTSGTAANSTKWGNKQLRVGSYTSGATGYITMGY